MSQKTPCVGLFMMKNNRLCVVPPWQNLSFLGAERPASTPACDPGKGEISLSAGRANQMIELSINIYFPNGSFRPKMAQLLNHIAHSGSIRAAAASTGMSYKTAHDLIQAMEDLLGGAVITAAAGSLGGGGSRLSKVGEIALLSYRRIETLSHDAVGSELKKLSFMARNNFKNKSEGRGKKKASPRQRKPKKTRPTKRRPSKL